MNEFESHERVSLDVVLDLDCYEAEVPKHEVGAG